MPFNCYTRQGSSRESSCDSTNSTSQPRGTIHHRRTVSRSSTSSPPPSLDGFISLYQNILSTPLVSPVPSDSSDDANSDAKRWRRMLNMQREFHCYQSARLEAAVEALERGEDPPVPSKLCLDLLNEELKAQIEAARMPV